MVCSFQIVLSRTEIAGTWRASRRAGKTTLALADTFLSAPPLDCLYGKRVLRTNNAENRAFSDCENVSGRPVSWLASFAF